MIKIKERPIIFNAQEVLATLAGDKTQHRVPFDFEFIKDASVPIVQKVADETDCNLSELVTGAYNAGTYDFDCPFGAIGDRLWVRETTLIDHHWDWVHADGSMFNGQSPDGNYSPVLPDGFDSEYEGFLPAACMPRWASRLLLEITDIRIERVQDIGEADALAMGVKSMSGHAWICALDKQKANPHSFECPAKFLHEMLWRESHGAGSWYFNDWVWVIEFKVIGDANGTN